MPLLVSRRPRRGRRIRVGQIWRVGDVEIRDGALFTVLFALFAGGIAADIAINADQPGLVAFLIGLGVPFIVALVAGIRQIASRRRNRGGRRR